VISDKDAVVMAAKRGELMDEDSSRCDGTMMAVLFVPLETVEQILFDMNEPHFISLANDNAPNQIVLTGSIDALDRFARKIESERLGKCKRVVVSGPWHSHFITSGREKFEIWVDPIHFKKPHTPLILNATAKPEYHPTTIKHLITYQLTSPVYWRDCMETCRNIGVDTFFEIGPGRVLSGLVRVNGFGRSTPVYNINNLRGIELAIDNLTKIKENE